MRARQEKSRIDLSKLQEISKMRNEWIVQELIRVKGLKDDDFMKTALEYLGRKEIYYLIKKAVKNKSLALEVA